jgi:uncharacterized protein (DUF169 family)
LSRCCDVDPEGVALTQKSSACPAAGTPSRHFAERRSFRRLGTKLTEYQSVAAELSSLLGLQSPPVAIAFADAPLSGVMQTTDVSPSTCGFWRLAENGVFYAAAAQHFNCQVGAMVMGFDLPEQVMQQLGGLVETMCNCGYLSPEEGDKIPSVAGQPAGVVYGPLADFPVEASAVVLWLTPQQAMLFNEAAGSASWAATPTRVGSRPACAAVPLAMSGNLPVLSLGCTGMRTFTEVADDRMLAVVPGDALASFTAALRGTAEANRQMQSFYEQRKAEVAAL